MLTVAHAHNGHRAVVAIGPRRVVEPPAPRTGLRHARFSNAIYHERQVKPYYPALTVVTHLLVLTAMVQLSRVEAVQAGPPVAGIDMVFVWSPAQAAARKAPEAVRRQPAALPGEGGGGKGGPVIGVPAAKGFQTIPTIAHIPTGIPPVNLVEKPLDPRNFSGFGVEGGVADGIVGGIKVSEVPDLIATELPGEGDGTGGGGGRLPVFREEQLEQVIRLLWVPEVRYPPVMRTAGVEGYAQVQFVVDTLGRVEPASFIVLEATNDEFAREARAVMLKAKFEPAVFAGRHVRQLARQMFRFRLEDAG